MYNDISRPLVEALYRQDLASFIGRSLEITHPLTRYVPNWHIALISEYLEACRRGELKRLIVNLPPRYMKSHAISVAWPAWLLGHNPARRIIAASYSSALALKHGMDCRALVQSEWFHGLFPALQLAKDQNQKAKFMTTQRGFRLSASVGGTLTGEGGEFMIVDDPHNAAQSASPSYRRRAVQWFEQTFMTRQDDLQHGCYVVVMQRLHPEDLTHALIEKGGWEQLIIPAIETAPRTYHFNSFTYERAAGECLNPLRDTVAALEQLKQDIGSHAFAAQYQQEPVAAEGKILKVEWLKHLDIATLPPESLRVHSWDTAIKTAQGNDFSVGLSWRIAPQGFVLEHMVRGQWDYPAVKKQISQLAEVAPAEAILIEDKASGQSLIQELKTTTHLPIIGIMPKGDKLQRLLKVLGLFEAGRVFLPENAPWLADVEREWLSFPEAPHDDMVDATTQFLFWAQAREKRENAWRIRVL